MSWDTFLGAPFNIASAALLLHIVAMLTGYTPTILNIFGGDVHLYTNHLDAVGEQIQRAPYALPELVIDEMLPGVSDGIMSYDGYMKHCQVADFAQRRATIADLAVAQLETLDPSWFTLHNYQHHDAIKAPMAV